MKDIFECRLTVDGCKAAAPMPSEETHSHKGIVVGKEKIHLIYFEIKINPWKLDMAVNTLRKSLTKLMP